MQAEVNPPKPMAAIITIHQIKFTTTTRKEEEEEEGEREGQTEKHEIKQT